MGMLVADSLIETSTGAKPVTRDHRNVKVVDEDEVFGWTEGRGKVPLYSSTGGEWWYYTKLILLFLSPPNNLHTRERIREWYVTSTCISCHVSLCKGIPRIANKSPIERGSSHLLGVMSWMAVSLFGFSSIIGWQFMASCCHYFTLDMISAAFLLLCHKDVFPCHSPLAYIWNVYQWWSFYWRPEKLITIGTWDQ